MSLIQPPRLLEEKGGKVMTHDGKPNKFEELTKPQKKYLRVLGVRYPKLPEYDLIQIAIKWKWDDVFILINIQ